jgi:hypothetical protein
MSEPIRPEQTPKDLSCHKQKAGLVISPKQLARFLTVVVVGLVVSHVSLQFVAYYTGHPTLLGLRRQFDLNHENNIPTWYSSLALLFCAVLLTIIWLQERKARATHVRYWQTLAAIFVVLATDEAASIHEMIRPILGPVLQSYDWFHGYLFYPWVIFGAAGVLIFVTAYLRFLASLPTGTKNLFLLAGTLYVGGALGFEYAGSRYDYLYGKEHFAYEMLVTCEEGLEMLGIVVFIYALTSYLVSLRVELHMLFSDDSLKIKLH